MAITAADGSVLATPVVVGGLSSAGPVVVDDQIDYGLEVDYTFTAAAEAHRGDSGTTLFALTPGYEEGEGGYRPDWVNPDTGAGESPAQLAPAGSSIDLLFREDNRTFVNRATFLGLR